MTLSVPPPSNGTLASQTSSMEQALQISEVRYRRLFETAQDGILLLNAETARIEDVNPFLMNLLGYSHKEFINNKIWEIGAFKDTAINKETFTELQTSRFIRYDDLMLVTKNGVSLFVEFVSNVFDCEGVQVIHCNIRDNSKRHLAEIALRATTRALKMLSEGSIALVNSETENILITEYCRIAVELGGYQMAWVGKADNNNNKITMLARAGQDGEYLESYIFPRQEGNIECSLTSLSLRSKQVECVDNISLYTKMPSWCEKALACGFQSAIALPFNIDNDRTACLTLYSSKIDCWSFPERKLLQKMAKELSFGILVFRTAASKIQYEIELRHSLEQIIQIVANTIEERDPYTAGHQKRVAALCTKIAKELGLSSERTHGLHLAASIHDLGKIGIPAEILAKPRRLTELEFGLIKEHSTIAFNIIKVVDFPWPIADIIVQHHERIDGSGYPMGLKEANILNESKILAVADVVEAMASHRPYRQALGISAALNEIKAQRGITLDAEAVDACLRIFNDQNYKLVE